MAPPTKGEEDDDDGVNGALIVGAAAAVVGIGYFVSSLFSSPGSSSSDKRKITDSVVHQGYSVPATRNKDGLRSMKYNVKFESNIIPTLVTNSPTMVDRWISENNARGSYVIGLDVEWHPNDRYNLNNPVATLQLCVSSGCLIFQILHSPYLPESLKQLLENSNCKFAGVGIKEDAEKLERDYGLRVRTTVDLAISSGRRGIGLKELARSVLGVDMDKPKDITWSDWDNYELTKEQVDYACIDAFVSYEIAKVLVPVRM